MKYPGKRYYRWLAPFVLLLLITFSAESQTKTKKPVKKTTPVKTQPSKKTSATKTTTPKTTTTKTTSPPRTVNEAEDEKRVRDIIAFFQYLLNTLGSSSTSARDKEVLVTQSYAKIFRDNKVQIEDDLDEERIVITNKDIVPYLKDVDFFFKDVKFEFSIEDIKSSTMPNGELFYKVSTRRILTGTTTEGNPVKTTLPRFIEVNYDPAAKDLKIVSIYTHELNETQAMTHWWNELSLEWQSILRKKLPAGNTVDSLQIADIKLIVATEALDLSQNAFIQDLEPLERLIKLKSLNLSGTRVSDLTPIRNLTELETLNLSHTKIADLSPLKYANKIVSLDISNTPVSDIVVLEKMPALQNLSMRETWVTDFSPLASLVELKLVNLAHTKISNLSPFENLVNITRLDISGTPVQDVNPLRNLKNISDLDIDSTRVSDLQPLSDLKSLQVLHANYTPVINLIPLQKLEHLDRIYVDHTGVTKQAVDKFIAVLPTVKIIFDSDNLKSWWDNLSPEWQNVFSKAAAIGPAPTKEEMAKVSNLDSINISGNARIDNLEPLRKLLKLHVAILNASGIHDLSPLQAHTEITYLDISETAVTDITLVGQFTKLKTLRADKSKIENMERLSMPALELFYADNTMVHDITAREFLEKNPKCLLIFKTVHLNRWWSTIPENWKEVFRKQMKTDTSSTRENLHKLVEQEALHFKDASVTDLNALSEFVRLKELHFAQTAIKSIPPLENIKSLTSLHATNSPLQQIESLSLLTSLEDLNISNTPIDDLKAVGSLRHLKKLNCSGTQIRRLDALVNLGSLEYLDCSNTNTGKLDPLDNLPLKTLTCYNTKITSRTIDNFKIKHPDCQVVYYK